jgi:uncharacterized protein YecE (DUF72 family)
MAKLHIGLSGYDYKEWQGEGLFYSPEVKRTQFLQDYARQFNSLEANGTFQRMPTAATIAKWVEMTGEGFTVSPKMVQNVTHFKRLNDEAIEIAKEFVKVLDPLAKAEKLGPILLQLPPNLKRDEQLLGIFFNAMPKGLKWAVEFRNKTWNTPEVANLLQQYGAAWVVAESDDDELVSYDTADFMFIRLRRISYTDVQLQQWAKVLKNRLSDGKDCYVYCRHKDTVEPWKWGERLRELI